LNVARPPTDPLAKRLLVTRAEIDDCVGGTRPLDRVRVDAEPAADAVAKLAARAGVPVDVDWDSLAAAGVTRDTVISVRPLLNPTLGDALTAAFFGIGKADAVELRASEGRVTVRGSAAAGAATTRSARE
jgi:hypothetical protein